MSELLLFTFCIAVGFVAAGLTSSLVQLVTGRPVVFALPRASLIPCILAGVSFTVIGPYIVARGAVRASLTDGKPLTWLAGGLTLALLWSACSGIIVLDIALSMGRAL